MEESKHVINTAKLQDAVHHNVETVFEFVSGMICECASIKMLLNALGFNVFSVVHNSLKQVTFINHGSR